MIGPYIAHFGKLVGWEIEKLIKKYKENQEKQNNLRKENEASKGLASSVRKKSKATKKMDFCLFVSDEKEELYNAESFSIGDNDGLKLTITLVDSLNYIYYIFQKTENQAVIFACVNESGNIYDAFKDWSDSKLKVLSSSAPCLTRMILNGRATRGDQVGLIPVVDSRNKIYDCAVRVIDFDWNTSDKAEELRRCHSIACQMLLEIMDLFKELNEGDLSTSQQLKIGAITFTESAQNALKVVRMGNTIEKVIGFLS